MPAQAWREEDEKYSQTQSYLTSPCVLKENLSSLQKSFVTTYMLGILKSDAAAILR